MYRLRGALLPAARVLAVGAAATTLTDFPTSYSFSTLPEFDKSMAAEVSHGVDLVVLWRRRLVIPLRFIIMDILRIAYILRVQHTFHDLVC